MALTESIPGMRPGATRRNAAVGAGYVFLLPFVVGLLALVAVVVIIAVPFVVAYVVGTNRNGVAERVAALPGISSTGGVAAGAAAFVYVVVAMGALGTVLPAADQPMTSPENSSLAGESGANASTEGGTTVVSPTTTSKSTPTETSRGGEDAGSSGAGASGATPTPPPDSPGAASSPDTPTPKAADEHTTPTRTPTPTPTSSPTAADGERTATVLRVVDGDTLKVRLDDGSEDTVRLLGVDTPEVHAENTPDEWEGVPNSEAGKECLRQEGHDASDWMKNRVADETVGLEFDKNEGKRGYYGRLLAYVYLDGQHVNYRLVERGNARVYDSSFEKRSSFYAAESDAQEREVGAWRCRNVDSETASPTPTRTPTEGSSGGSGQLSVARVHEDAQGDDHENENDEYVVFENTGDGALDLSNWEVSDEADHTYTVPDGFTLDAGATVTLYTGSGQDSESELYWGSDAAIWNNGGDTIYVHTDDGEQVIAYEY